MSREDVEIVRGALEAFNCGDMGSVFDVLDPEVEFVTATAAQATYRGHAGVRELHALLQEAFDEIRFEPDEVCATSDAVIVLGRMCVRGRGSGAVGQSRRALVFTLRDGKIVRQQAYDDQKEARQAVGLRE